MNEPNLEISTSTESSPVWEAISERVRLTINQECKNKVDQVGDPEEKESLAKRVKEIFERERKFVEAFLKALQEAKEKAGTGKIMILSDFDLTLGYKDLETKKPVLRPSAISLLEYLNETEKNIEFYFFTDRGEDFLFQNLPEEVKNLLKVINGENPKRPTFIYSTRDLGSAYGEDSSKIYKAVDTLKQSGEIPETNLPVLEDLKYNPDTLAKLVSLQLAIKDFPAGTTFVIIEDLDYPKLLSNPNVVCLTVEPDFQAIQP